MSLSLRLKSFLVSLLIVTLLLTLLTRPFASHAQNPTTVESDDPRVFQNGTWASQSAPAASNGSYLYNGPSPVGAGLRPAQSEPVLALAFVGSAIEIIYVSGPQFGTLSIEIDGTVLRTVITTAEEIDYGQVAKVDYLSDEPHSLKVYAQAGGIIALDAFRITPVTHLVGDGPVPSQAIPTRDDGGIQSSTCAPPNAIHRVSLTHTGGEGSFGSFGSSLSAEGRFVAFSSDARLAPGDGDTLEDIYVYDRHTCALQLISVNSANIKGNGTSRLPHISSDGRFVAFISLATNLGNTDTNGADDVFVHDRQTGFTTRVSVATGGAQANGASNNPGISADGRFISFVSGGSNLVTGDTNGLSDVFVHDRQTGTTTRVSVATGGVQGTGGLPFYTDISGDGRYVTFSSRATNMVAGDTNGLEDVFVHDRQTGTTTRVSVGTGGVQGTGGESTIPYISADGRYVLFTSNAANLVTGDTNGNYDIFLHDRTTTTTTRVSVATGGVQGTGGGAISASISANGRFVAFQSLATNLVAGDTNGQEDVFVHDRQTSITTRVSVAAGGVQAMNGPSSVPAISSDGRYIQFSSSARNLVPGDTNLVNDVFVTPLVQPAADTLVLFQPVYHYVTLLNTLSDNPPFNSFTAFSAYAPITSGQWVMGDWNGDGLKTPGVYDNGPFYYTNKAGESQPSDWFSLWIGVPGIPVSGRFNGALANDCIGAVQPASSGGQTVFVLYFTCNLTGTTTPAISSQWLSAVLPDSGGFSGVHQFGAGDFNGDGVDSIAVRRGTFIAFGNVAPSIGPATFDLAQFIGAPQPGADAGIFVVGSWDGDIFDSFGLFYQNGEFFFRNDHLFNSGAFANQSIGQPFAGTVQATSWR